MKPTKICISSNENPNYIQFWPMIASAWKKLGFEPMLALVTDQPEDKWDWMKDYGEIVRFNTHPTIPSGNWAKVCRWYLYGRYTDEISIVSDVDMLPLQKDYYLELPEGYEPEKHLILKGADAYGVREGHGDSQQKSRLTEKFPGCYMTAKGSIWRDILNISDYATFEEWAHQYCDSSVYDAKESLESPSNVFSEESLMRVVVLQWDPEGERTMRLSRPGGWVWGPQTSGLRVDRSAWPNASGWDLMGFGEGRRYPQKLPVGYYIDAHLPRPLDEHKENIYPLLNYLDLSPSLIDIGIQLSHEMV